MQRFQEWELGIIKNNLDKTNKEISKLFLPHRSPSVIGYICGKNNWQKIRGRQWSEEEKNLFIKLYPDNSFYELTKVFSQLSKSEYNWMGQKHNLKQSQERGNERRKNNSLKNQNYFSKEKINFLLNLYEKNNLDDTLYKFLLKYPMHKEYFLVNYLFKNKHLREMDIFSYKNLSKIMDNTLFVDAFYNYKRILYYKPKKSVIFSKEQTIYLFKYWLRINNINTSKENILQIKSFRKYFIDSYLEGSIKKHFKYYYEFIQYVFPRYKILPWELKIQVLDNFWQNNINVYWMTREGIRKLIKDNIIQNDVDVLYLPKDILEQYFNKLTYYKDGRNLFIKYFNNKNINIDLFKLKIIDNIQFDSLEEMLLYKHLKSLGLNVKKYSKKHKLFNEDHNESYIPDLIIFKNKEKIILEYFGLYLLKPNSTEFIKSYIDKTHRKIDFYKKNIKYFIDLYPEDIQNNFEGVRQKLTSFFNENFDSN